MSDIDTPRRPGPWDARPEDAHTAPSAAAEPARAAEAPLDKGQHPLWALISTLLLGGLIFYWTGSLVIVAAVLFGLLVHEYGHVLAMNRLGMGPARIYIVPFLGGLAKGQRMPASEWHGVLVALAGPAFGLLAAIPFYGLYLWTGQPVWLGGVLVIAFINLINLAPAPPLDGSKALGPVLARIHPMLEKVALFAVGATAVAWGLSNGSWIFAGFLALALFSHLRRGAWRPEGRQLTWGESAKSVGLFLLTAMACVGVGLAALLPGVETV
ncbi:MAG: peptidase M50, partial [Brevundimonas sp.]